MDPRRRFARNLRRHRVERRLTQGDLAVRARLHRTEISLLEGGRRDPRLTTIVRLAHALDITAADLCEQVD